MPESIRIQDDVVIQINDPAEALKLLTKAEMRSFTKQDWFCWAGCETKDPLIGEVDGFEICLDGATLNIIHGEDGYGGTLFELVGRN